MTQYPPTIVLFILLIAFFVVGAYAVSKFIEATGTPGPWPKWFIIPLFLFLGFGMVWSFQEFIFWIFGRNRYVLSYIITVVFMTAPIIHLVRWGRNLLHGKQVKDYFHTVDGVTTLGILNVPIQSIGALIVSLLSLGGVVLVGYIILNMLYAMLF